MLAHLFLLYTNYFIATTHLKYYQKYLFIYRPFFFFKELFIFRLNVCFMFLIFLGGAHGLLLLLCLNGLSLLNSFLIHWRPIRIWATCRGSIWDIGSWAALMDDKIDSSSFNFINWASFSSHTYKIDK